MFAQHHSLVFIQHLISPLQVCHICKATKGTHDVSWSYSNVADDAPWRNTLYEEPPWASGITPSFAGIVGFSTRQLSIDTLHVWHLGVGRDLCGSAIKILASKRNFWRGRTIDHRLNNATGRLKSFLKHHGHSALTMHKLTKASVNWKSDQYPELKSKGFDTYLVWKWLVHEIETQDCGNDLLATVPDLKSEMLRR